MKKKTQGPQPDAQCELLIMPDGQVYAHNLTPQMAMVLGALNPEDQDIKRRAITRADPETKKLLPASWDDSKVKS